MIEKIAHAFALYSVFGSYIIGTALSYLAGVVLTVWLFDHAFTYLLRALDAYASLMQATARIVRERHQAGNSDVLRAPWRWRLACLAVIALAIAVLYAVGWGIFHA